MITAIVVEDERLIREGITEQVPWKKLHIDEVRTAANAEIALNTCTGYHPDIVISDIRMPGMDGITLCTKLRELLPDAQIIFISGYSDKEYLMSAIDLHAVHYIEKPISLTELVGAIRTAVSELQKTRTEKNNVLHTLLNASFSTQNEDPLLLQTKTTTFFVTVLQRRGRYGTTETDAFTDTCKRIRGCGMPCLIDFTDERKMVVLFFSEDKRKLAELYQNTDFWASLVGRQTQRKSPAAFPAPESLFAGIGIQTAGSDGVRQSYETAVQALNCRSFKGWCNYAYNSEAYTERTAAPEPRLFADFKKALADRQEQRALNILSAVYRQLVGANSLLTHPVRNLYYTLDDAVQKAYGGRIPDAALPAEGTAIKEHAETIQELHAYLCCSVHAALSAEDTRKSSFICKRITNYIQNQYADKQLSVQSIADAVFLTPTYISCLFKKETGQTIGQYLLEYRLKKAEEFLRNPQYKIYQIADMVGYADAHYFARLFRKQTGLKPSDFRNQADYHEKPRC
jgi:two-component system response regulator YesN